MAGTVQTVVQNDTICKFGMGTKWNHLNGFGGADLEGTLET